MILSPILEWDMKAKHIDKELTLEILENYNRGRYAGFTPSRGGLPHIDGENILDMGKEQDHVFPWDEAKKNVHELLPGHEPEEFGTREGSHLLASGSSLRRLGVLLYPKLSYGILNGGLGTSYADELKNSAAFPALFSLHEEDFVRLSPLSKGKAKGLAPAYVNPDGSPGYSYLELKFRFLLIESLRYAAVSGKAPLSLPFFQMTNISTDEELSSAYREYRRGPMLSDLIAAAGFDVTEGRTGIQPLIAAYTHSDEGKTKALFTQAYGKKDSLLPLPGGHGQNFRVLEGVYRDLHDEGRRFAYLGNVDNLGYLIDPLSLGYLALTGRQAGFDFAFRTPLDVKGGILISDGNGKLTCADIGPAISLAEATKAEKEEGKSILFNCATGLFDLNYLTDNMDAIKSGLPMRFSDQDKEAGRYSQAEQITWEIIGMMDNALVFAIDKYERFLPAKFLIETLVMSGVKGECLSHPIPEALLAHAKKLNAGLERLLSAKYGMTPASGRWEPLPSGEVIRKLTQGEL
jgi:UTP--glucose-1-phosphate uridylyltransferase